MLLAKKTGRAESFTLGIGQPGEPVHEHRRPDGIGITEEPAAEWREARSVDHRDVEIARLAHDAVFQTNRGYNFVQGLAFALGAGMGLTLALTLMASIRVRTELTDVPRLARPMAIVLIIASCLSMAFMGFAGLGAS